jgi:polyphosphate kinase
MAISIAGAVDLSNSARPMVHLSAVPTPAWRHAFEAYVTWAKNGPAPANPPAETHFGTVVQNSDFDVVENRLVLALEPFKAFEHVKTFVDEAIAYANSQAP